MFKFGVKKLHRLVVLPFEKVYEIHNFGQHQNSLIS